MRSGDQWVELVGAPEQRILALRRDVIGYVSQFLRVIPRVAALDVVAEPLRAAGVDAETARARAAALLQRLNVPARLWGLAPATFSGGEQQRVNIARGFIARHPVLLLDEPTASLDADNRKVVIELIHEARAEGRCLLGIFHDEEVRDAVATKILTLRPALAATADMEA
ncbi:Alpha-D-ribose 1-methylphosphonate 5-triphosphate synthase subunit PhnL [compost metagenome]